MTTKMQIDEAYENVAVCPMIVSFQNGYISEEFNTTSGFSLENSETNSRNIATVIDNIVYAGEEESEVLGKNLLLARDRTTGKVRLIEVGSIDLKPFIEQEVNSSELLESSHLELSRKFGSKKNKQVMEQREKLKVNTETVTVQMQNVTENITEEKLDLSTYTINDSDDFYIPPINRNATDVQSVYDFNDILTEELYEKIYSEMEGKDYQFHDIIQAVSSDDLSLKQTVLASYASSLYDLYMKNSKEIGRKSFVANEYSSTLNEVVLANFTQISGKNRLRPPMYKDKSFCYALVMTLLICNFKVDMNVITSPLKMTPSLAATKAKATGATIVSLGDKKYIQLKLPLSTNKIIRRKSAKF